MSFEAGRRCETCGCESPYVPVCGECEVSERYGVEIAGLQSKLTALLEAAERSADRMRGWQFFDYEAELRAAIEKAREVS